MSDVVVRLRVGGVVFEAEKESLLRFDHTFFYGLFSSGAWQPDADGAYYIDRPALGFDRILEYLSSGKLSVEGLSELEEECVYSSLDYLLIPYKREWKYNTESLIEGFRAYYVCELKDGRLCGAYRKDIIVWSMHTNAVDMTMKGHTKYICKVIQLHDGRVCSFSDDTTIRLWNINSGLCELIMTDDHMFHSVIQLFNGRLCSSCLGTINIWNLSTGVCEMTTNTLIYLIKTLVQLSDGRICCGHEVGWLSIYSLVTGECEISWKGHFNGVNAIVCIDAATICSASADRRPEIKVWKTDTGECLRSLEGQLGLVTSIIRMQDGRRLCSSSDDWTLKLWNLETGECEKTLAAKDECYQVLQLEDGRLLSTQYTGIIVVWS